MTTSCCLCNWQRCRWLRRRFPPSAQLPRPRPPRHRAEDGSAESTSAAWTLPLTLWPVKTTTGDSRRLYGAVTYGGLAPPRSGLQPCAGGHVAAPDDAEDVLCALRLGWFLAESRGRNRPGGQLGVRTSLPDHIDHALPLRVERGPTELRIEAQKVVAQLAVDLQVDTDSAGTSFAEAMDDKARTLNPVRAPKASAALQWTLDQLRMAAAGRSYPGDSAPPTPQQALQTLQAAVDPQQQAVTAATARGDQATAAGEQRGLDALHTAITALQATNDGDVDAAQARVTAVRESLQVIATAASDPWQDLAEL